MKKQILSAVLVLTMLVTGTVAHAAPNSSSKEVITRQKIVEDFSAKFLSTPIITLTEDGFIASSVVDGHQVSSVYDKKGNKIYSIVRYTSNNLDKDIVDAVKINYDKYFIAGMDKIEQPGFKAVYIVHLTDSKSIKTIRISEDGSELMQSFKEI
jgi:hypothetical protein